MGFWVRVFFFCILILLLRAGGECFGDLSTFNKCELLLSHRTQLVPSIALLSNSFFSGIHRAATVVRIYTLHYTYRFVCCYGLCNKSASVSQHKHTHMNHNSSSTHRYQPMCVCMCLWQYPNWISEIWIEISSRAKLKPTKSQREKNTHCLHF